MGEVVPARTSPTLHPPSPPTVHLLSRLALLRVNFVACFDEVSWGREKTLIHISKQQKKEGKETHQLIKAQKQKWLLDESICFCYVIYFVLPDYLLCLMSNLAPHYLILVILDYDVLSCSCAMNPVLL